MKKEPEVAKAEREPQHITEERIHLIEGKLVQMEKLMQLQGDINGKLLENLNSLLLWRAEQITKADQPSGLILPPGLNS